MPDFLARRCCADGCKSIIVGTYVCEFRSQTDYRPVLNGEVLEESPFLRGELDDLAEAKGWFPINETAWLCTRCLRQKVRAVLGRIDALRN